MAVSVLITFPILDDGFSKDNKIQSSKDVINIVGDLFNEHPNCQLYATSQTHDKLSKGTLKNEQKIRFDAFFKEENTTRGVRTFNIHNSIGESAKALSYKGFTIVICDESEKEFVHKNKRIISVNPQEFIDNYKQALELDKHLASSFLDFVDLLIFNLLRPEIKDYICKTKER